MQRTRRSPGTLVALVTLAVLALASCGVEPGAAAPDGRRGSTATTVLGDRDGGDPDDRSEPSPTGKTTTTTGATGDRTPLEQQLVDTTASTYEQFGLEADDARCLAEAMVDAQMTGGPVEQLDAMGFFADCGLGLEELSAMSEKLGSSPEEALRTSMTLGLVNQGMSEDDAACVVDAYIDEYGSTDATSFQDFNVQIELFEGCDVALPGN